MEPKDIQNSIPYAMHTQLSPSVHIITSTRSCAPKWKETMQENTFENKKSRKLRKIWRDKYYNQTALHYQKMNNNGIWRAKGSQISKSQIYPITLPWHQSFPKGFSMVSIPIAKGIQEFIAMNFHAWGFWEGSWRTSYFGLWLDLDPPHKVTTIWLKYTSTIKRV